MEVVTGYPCCTVPYSRLEGITFGDVRLPGSRVELIISASVTVLEILGKVFIMCAVWWKRVRYGPHGGRVFLMMVVLEEIRERGSVSL